MRAIKISAARMASSNDSLQLVSKLQLPVGVDSCAELLCTAASAQHPTGVESEGSSAGIQSRERAASDVTEPLSGRNTQENSGNIVAAGGDFGLCLWRCDHHGQLSSHGNLRPIMQLGISGEASGHTIFGSDAVSAVAFSPTDEHRVFAGAGKRVLIFDLRNPGRCISEATLNYDDINEISVHHKGGYIAAADDSGAIRILDVSRASGIKSYKTLRGKGSHTSICSTVKFRPQRPWELISGGLDSMILHWDFGRGQVKEDLSMNTLCADQGADGVTDAPQSQICNPPFVYSLAPSSCGAYFFAGIGDGSIACFRFGQRQSSISLVHRVAMAHSTAVTQVVAMPSTSNGTNLRLWSGGNDKHVRLWCLAEDATHRSEAVASANNRAKINWMSAVGSQCVAVADTTQVVKLYSAS
eukprot:m.674239 g.674239  ORF g.674239 m.674239 type:complete len:413 (+) comp22783_c0_seq48:89-1327(+)